MDPAWWWSWLLTAVGVTGFLLSGSKVWWCWYVNIACQGLWLAYSIITEQWGFLAATAIYSAVFTRNAIRWTREHFARECTCWGEPGTGTGLDVTHRNPTCPRHHPERSGQPVG